MWRRTTRKFRLKPISKLLLVDKPVFFTPGRYFQIERSALMMNEEIRVFGSILKGWVKVYSETLRCEMVMKVQLQTCGEMILWVRTLKPIPQILPLGVHVR